MTTDNKASVRATIGDLLKADNPDGDRLRQFAVDTLLRLAREGAVHCESPTILPIPAGLLEAIHVRPESVIKASPEWSDSGPYNISTSISTQGPGKGLAAFAAIIKNADGFEKEVSCWASGASSQEAEVRALITALEQIPKGSTATITSTNSVTVRSFSEWMPQWKNARWRTTAGGEIAGVPLWRWVDVLAAERNITMVCVPKKQASPTTRRAALLALMALEEAKALVGEAQ